MTSNLPQRGGLTPPPPPPVATPLCLAINLLQRLSIKDVRSQGGCPVREILRTKGEGGLQMSELFGAKPHRIFRNLWCVRTDKGPLSQCEQWGRELIIRNFVGTSFMDGPLTEFLHRI